MMLSSRRFWCVVCLCAVVAGGLIIEPLQRLAKQSAFKYAFGKNLSAANFHLHAQQELLEFNELKTTQFDDVVQVNATAEIALVKLDMPTLLDKRFVSSRVKLQGVRIELASLPVQEPSAATVNCWQRSLEEILTAFQWENLRNDCEALLKSDSVLDELDNRMRGWLLRSQQIMFHGDLLTQAVQANSNPLRHQNEIRNQLTQLEQLRLEQDNLQKQFKGINAILVSQLKEIQSVGDQDIATMRAKCDAKTKILQNAIAEQIVSEWAKQLLSRQLQLSQSFATLFKSNVRSNPYDVDIRNPSARTPLLSLSGIVADGFLCDATKQLPFSAKGEYATVQKTEHQLARKTDWEIQFAAGQIATQLHIASAESDSAWSLTSTSGEYSSNAVSESRPSLMGDQKAALAESLTMLGLEASLDGQFNGKVRMNLGMYLAFTKLPCPGNADLGLAELASGATTATAAHNEDWIEFTLSGSAFEPQVALVSELPAEFASMITDCIQKRLETQRMNSESKFKLALSAKIDEASKQLELLAKEGQQTVAKQQEVLTARHRELEQRLQTRDGFEYARLPAKPNTNR